MAILTAIAMVAGFLADKELCAEVGDGMKG